MRNKISILGIGIGALLYFSIGNAKGIFALEKVNDKLQYIEASASSRNSCGYEFNNGYAELVDKVFPAVVNISTTSIREKEISPIEQFFGMGIFPFEGMEHFRGLGRKIKQKSHSLGSGFFIDAAGHIATNYHVVKDATEIKIKTHDGKEYKAKVIGTDEKSDLAVIKAEIPKAANFAVFGSSTNAKIGDRVIAIGNPFGLGGTVTTGIISAKSRSIGHGPYDDFLQTDAAINRGNSGGPMFNTCGEVVGINAAIFSTSGGNIGIGFAIASDTAINILNKLKNKEKIIRAWLGVEVQSMTDEIADAAGVSDKNGGYVNGVSKNSPAEKAGLKGGDIIVDIDGKAIQEFKNIASYVASKSPGDIIKITIIRDGKRQTLQATLAQAPENTMTKLEKESVSHKDTFGLVVESLTPEKRTALRIPIDIEGVLVVDVKNSALEEFGEILAGDVLTSINGYEVKSPLQLAAVAQKVKRTGKKHAIFKLYRQGVHISIGAPIK